MLAALHIGHSSLRDDACPEQMMEVENKISQQTSGITRRTAV